MVNPILNAVVKTVVWIINGVDAILSLAGIRLYNPTLERILNGLPPEELEEVKKPEVARPLAAMSRGLVRDRQLTLVDRYLQVQSVRRQIRLRVGVEETLIINPDLKKLPTNRPMYIIGFPRTGTTLLFNLLACDPELRAPYFFEILTPYPPGLPDNWKESARYKEGKHLLDVRRMTGNSDFDRAHLMRADLPEECVFFFARNFFMYHPMLRIASCKELEEWFYGLDKEELTAIYQYYKTQLQIIGGEDMKKKRWILKAHIHMLALDALLTVFPDACLIFTYRKLSDMIGSFCSMVEKGTGSWGPADAQYGQRALKFLSTLANRAVKVMKQYEGRPKNEQPFFNLEYTQLVKQPMETVRAIYAHYDLHLTQEAENAMMNYLEKNRQHKHGSHKYSLAEYGITIEDVKDKFAPYLDHFKDESSNLL